MEQKYILTEETKVVNGHTLHRIKAVCDFNDVKVGQLGGFIESEANLSHEGNAWVYDDAKVYDDANVYGYASICGDAEVSSIADYIVFKNWWSSGRCFTWTRSNDKWRVGCFYGSGEELIAKAYKDSETSGREYKRIVEYVESIKLYHETNRN